MGTGTLVVLATDATRVPQFSSFKGGQVVDLVVDDRNLFDLAPDAIGEAKVLLTLFERAEVYRDPAL